MTTDRAIVPTEQAIPDDVRMTAIAVIVAPDGMEQVAVEVPATRILWDILFAGELVRRAKAWETALVIEATMALDRMELTDPRITFGGHRYQLQQDSRTDWTDIPGLLYLLNRMGLSVSDIASAVNGLRVTDLRTLAAKLPEDVRQDALDSIKAHRERKDGPMALVDLDSDYRRKR